MSVDYEYRCLTCSDVFDLGDRSNHGGEEAATLLRVRSGLESFGATLSAPGVRHALESIRGPEVSSLVGLARWLHEHSGHDVRLFSEYGAEWGTCGEMIQCGGGCGHWRHCSLAPKHDGDHRP